MRHRFITFLTDFGLEDDFVGACHGVMLTLAPEARIIDITHGITAGGVLEGALVLRNTVPYMPVGVHLAVVDPGVGGARRALALLASASAARAYARAGGRGPAISIGPQTTAAAQEAGVDVVAEAESHDVLGLVDSATAWRASSRS